MGTYPREAREKCSKANPVKAQRRSLSLQAGWEGKQRPKTYVCLLYSGGPAITSALLFSP
jgi:hypothetical protein